MSTTDYQQCAILYVDDEVKSLRNFERAFGDSFRILTAENAQEGLRLLREHRDEIGLLMTDERMPGNAGCGCWRRRGGSSHGFCGSW
jgi:two-component system, probable response regulator PhcQ